VTQLVIPLHEAAADPAAAEATNDPATTESVVEPLHAASGGATLIETSCLCV
jgi:hypothetical protein